MRDIARLVTKIQHDTIGDAFVVFVGVNVTAEDLKTGRLVLFHERSSGKADKGRLGHDRLHRLMKLTGLGAVTLVHEDKKISLGFEPGRQGIL